MVALNTPTLEEEHDVGVGHREECTQVEFNLFYGDDDIELLIMVAHHHDAHLGAITVL